MSQPALHDLLTLFTTCKPFQNDADVMQKNALLTWEKLGVSVLLMGHEQGVAEQAEAMQARHIDTIQYHESGVPFVHDLFKQAQSLAMTPYVCYFNSDILLTENVGKKLEQLLCNTKKHRPFFATARRRNIPLSSALPSETQEMYVTLQNLDARFGNWDCSDAIDMFLFPTGSFTGILPFKIGRMKWDNWLLWKAKDLGLDIIDLSLDMHLLHPIHGYGSDGSDWLVRAHGAEAVDNRNLAGGDLLAIKSACTHIFSDGNIITLDQTRKNTLEDHCAPDRGMEFEAGVTCLLDTHHTMSAHQITDYCRTLLWRVDHFFPILQKAEISATKLQRVLDQISSAQTPDEVRYLLQDMLADHFMATLLKMRTKDRPLYIWGAGQAGGRLIEFLTRHNVTPYGFIDSNPALTGTKVHNTGVYANTTIDTDTSTAKRPYILIASMYAQEIAQNLQLKGYQLEADFLG